MEEKFTLPQEMIDAFKEISKMFTAQQRQAVTMLAGFIATEERDLHYMDTYMDPLYDFIEPESDTEDIVRKYIDYISTFDEKNAKMRLDDLEDTLGYKTKIIYAAGLLAQSLHEGQLDKGGNDYFKSHLLKVAESGYGWKEKVTGFLHDASEDCDVSVEEVMDMLDKEIERVTANQDGYMEEQEWWQDWMEDIMPFPAKETHPLTDDERKEIAQTLNLLNHHTATSRSEYIDRLRGHFLAIKTKLHDLENNMDLSRIPTPSQKDYDRLDRYKQEYAKLLSFLDKISSL